MSSPAPVQAPGIPDRLWDFLQKSCGLPTDALHWLPEEGLPPTARNLLAHERDMTSTLADFHASPLRVEIIQHVLQDDLYLREVFLRTQRLDLVVEYGVIAIVLAQFNAPQRAAIHGGRAPLGGLLHAYRIPFVSSPLGFFSVEPQRLPHSRLSAHARQTCFGRFNHLARPTGEPIAWIMEILPTLAPSPANSSPHP